MNIDKSYQHPHKIKTNWKDIQKLIALENELLEKLKYLENKLDRLWKLANK